MMPVLTGKSIKGALRHRALKILKTLEVPDAEKSLQGLMGWVEADGKSNAVKSRLRIEEVIMEGVEEGVSQNRIRIDRFTGGTMNGALFNSLPVWANEGEKHLTLILTLPDDYKDWEATLLLHLLKDLWTEDLPIGGEKSIGRGILTGKRATITNNSGKISFERKEKKGGLTFIDGDINSLAPFNKDIRELIANTNPVPI
jgi:CRISPR/Cas system CMR subunit Cmr4 (Cas7 group RAMP superfamily)